MSIVSEYLRESDEKYNFSGRTISIRESQLLRKFPNRLQHVGPIIKETKTPTVTYAECKFPKEITNYTTKIKFKTEQEKQLIIISIAEIVSNIWAEFLTSNYHEEKKSESALDFYQFPNTFPTCDEVNKFTSNLKSRIVQQLNVDDEDGNSVKVSTNYGPEMLLAEVLKETELCFTKYGFVGLFPRKSRTLIECNFKLKVIDFQMGYTKVNF